jgi:hypothetical protein
VSGVSLRPVEDADLDALSGQMRDPESVWMAAFTARDPDDRAAFDARMARLRRSPDMTLRAVTCDGRLAGSIASFVIDGRTEITYLIERASWARGSRAWPWRSSSGWCPPGRYTLVPPATMPPRSMSFTSPVSRPSEPRPLVPRDGTGTSRKPSSG